MSWPDNYIILNLPAWFEKTLLTSYSSAESRAIAKVVMEELSGKQISFLYAEQKARWSESQMNELNKIIIRLKNNEPIQYILGVAYFMDLRFAVKPGVLIPRGETEELVDWIIKDLKERDIGKGEGFRILDVGCGSGIIGISLAKEFPESKVICADLYDLPLEMSIENAKLNHVDIEVAQMDALQPTSQWLEESFDIIVSNPPYVTEYQATLMKKNVLEFEPETALFVSDDDPLIFYNQISRYASKTLKTGGCLYFEINEDFGNETKDMINTYFHFVELKKDIHEKDRMIKAHDGTR